MTPAAWLAVALASVAGSLHCAAMCGGFVAAYAGEAGGRTGARTALHVLYNAGRLVTYAVLGASAGALGRALDLAGRAAGVAHVAAIATGVLLLLSGAVGLAPRSGFVRLKKGPGRPLAGGLSRLLASFRDKPPAVRAALLGLTTTLLPCGWLYAFVAVAAGSGGAVDGALVMSAFWVGSLPVLLGVGVSLELVVKSRWARLPRLRSVLILGAGVVTLLSRFQAPAFAASAPAAHRSDAALPRAADCPCH
ncbi:MAG TPA: sulfite exporter TauE/SafE family protein, partial [Polyangiaceae bacterium]